MKKIGIDVSEHQDVIDYAKTASQIDFAIVREGCRQRIDERFLEHVAGFQRASVPVIGVYHFIYAMNVGDAKLEALSCIRNVEKAGLPKTAMIWADMEYDTVEKAEDAGVTITPQMANDITVKFCETVKEAGYPVGIYTNNDWIVNWYSAETIGKYPLWLADYTGDPDHACIMQQYSESGVVEGIDGTVDMDYYFGEVATMGITAQDALNVFRGWIGKKESDNSHRAIIDIYNSYTPRARGYQVQYNDQWCDTAVSAVFIALHAVELIGGPECGVEQHVKLFKAAGIWHEDGTIKPEPGDIIVFNWNETVQPNDGYADHIGMVESVSGNTITTIEGNYKDSVGRRSISIGNGYIRGYARPKYATAESTQSVSTQTPASGSTAEYTTVRRGSTGSAVRTLQEMLVKLGYSLTVDGDFGPATESAVKGFQSLYGLESDGIVGTQTWSKLNSLTSAGKPSSETKWVGSIELPPIPVRTAAYATAPVLESWPYLGQGNMIEVCDEVYGTDGKSWAYIKIAGKHFGFVPSENVRRSCGGDACDI